jgi:hypothetical protein
MALIAIDNRFYIYRYLTHTAKANGELTYHAAGAEPLPGKIIGGNFKNFLCLSKANRIMYDHKRVNVVFPVTIK